MIEAVQSKMSGVVNRLERGVAAGLAMIANETKDRVDAVVTERFALIAGEARMKMRKLEAKAAKVSSRAAVYEDNL